MYQQSALYFSLLIGVVFAGKLVCKQNEEFSLCSSQCPLTCQNRTLEASKCPLFCQPGCTCKKGFVRTSVDGPCVPEELCDEIMKCGENEEFSLCGSACPPTCDDPSIKQCTLACVRGCFCKEGFVRNTETNKCVRKETCVKEICKENEVYKNCGSPCEPTCSNPVKICPRVCTKGCFCKVGYVVDEKSGKCVKPEQCS